MRAWSWVVSGGDVRGRGECLGEGSAEGKTCDLVVDVPIFGHQKGHDLGVDSGRFRTHSEGLVFGADSGAIWGCFLL